MYLFDGPSSSNSINVGSIYEFLTLAIKDCRENPGFKKQKLKHTWLPNKKSREFY
jgi:hypothetical protein